MWHEYIRHYAMKTYELLSIYEHHYTSSSRRKNEIYLLEFMVYTIINILS
jgi:hypothetical protein